MIERLIEDLAHGLGQWAYLLVTGMVYLETAAMAGLVAPGEVAAIVGGVLAGEGALSVYVLCGLVWLAAVLGDTTGFFLGRRLGRAFLHKHGPRLRISEKRLDQVDQYFAKHGGKTIIVGRWIGFVRPLAPFLAGASGMAYKRFFPYDLLSAGAWTTTFVLLGYFFWQSFAQIADAAGKGTLVFGVAVALIVAIVMIVHHFRRPENRQRLRAWADRQAGRPILRPAAVIARPIRRVLMPQLRFLAGRLTPGSDFGLEFTSLLAASAIGSYIFALYTSLIVDGTRLTPADKFSSDLVAKIQGGALTDLAKAVSVLGSAACVGVVVAIACAVLIWRRLRSEAVVLLAGSVLTFVAVLITKQAVDRPRPSGGLVDAVGSSFPSGHAAYSIAYVAIAFTAWLVASRFSHRVLIVVAAIALAAAIGFSRVYLGVHYLSDVNAGWALGVTVYGTCGALGLIVSFLRENKVSQS